MNIKQTLVLCYFAVFVACASGPSYRKTHQLVGPNGAITCFEPPPDVMTAGTKASVDASVSRIVQTLKLNADTSTTYSRIRAEVPNLQALEATEFRLCVAYANGLLSKDQYSKFMDLLPSLKSSGATGAPASGTKSNDSATTLVPSQSQPQSQAQNQSQNQTIQIGSSSTESSHKATETPALNNAQSTQGFDVSLTQCTRRGGTVLCSLLVTNRERERRLQLSFIGSNHPRAFGSDGAEYGAELNDSHLGNLIGNSDVTMPTDVPIRAILTFRDVPSTCQTFTALQVWFYSSGPPTNVVFRNVAIAI